MLRILFSMLSTHPKQNQCDAVKREKGNRFPQEMNRRLTAIEQKNGKKERGGKHSRKKEALSPPSSFLPPSHGPFVTNNQHKLTDGTRLPPPHGIYTDIRFFFSGGGKRSECPKKSRRRRGSSDLSVRLNIHVHRLVVVLRKSMREFFPSLV